jgi:hypothetical protein
LLFAIVRSWLQLIILAHKLTMYRPCLGEGVHFFFLEPDQTHPQQQSLTLTYFIVVCVVLGLGKRVVGEGCDVHKGMTKTNIHTYRKISQCCVRIPYELGHHHTIVESVDLPVL